jgi:ATP-dependent DNA helicase PIF1
MNTEQTQALQAILQGRNVFLTGQGGTGKSFLIKKIADSFKERNKTLAITATTGCAALLLGEGAKTIFSWAGVGLGEDPTGKLIAMISRSKKTLTRWLLTDSLIIDETSMMTADLFEKLDAIAKNLRANQLPFGGIQLILVGDFYQLPPVAKQQGPVAKQQGPVAKQQGQEVKFVFESPLWSQTIHHIIELKQIMRQTDPVFQKILSEVREGYLSPESHTILKGRMKLPWQKEKIRPSLLFTRRSEVDYINTSNLKALKGERHTFSAMTKYSAVATNKKDTEAVQKAIAKLDRDAAYSPELTLAVDAQVMLIKNISIETGLVNGSRGVITGFGPGPLYEPKVLFKGHSYPVSISPQDWEVEDAGVKGVKRSQLPLVLAYAITIHKSQGSTLDCALVDISASTFEYGQAYVALSRAKSLEALYVHDIDPKAIRAHPKVIEFYKGIKPLVLEDLMANMSLEEKPQPQPQSQTQPQTQPQPQPDGRCRRSSLSLERRTRDAAASCTQQLNQLLVFPIPGSTPGCASEGAHSSR